MYSIDRLTLQRANQALEKARISHLYDLNVSHIDLGFRIKDSEGGRIENQLAVRVHLRKKLKGDEFKAFAAKYPERVIDDEAIGFPVDRPEADYRLHYWWWDSQMNNGESRSRYHDVLKGGISIANEWSYGYGTLGGKVKDRRTGEEMILSNWHVLVGSWFAKPGLAIYQPAQGDGGTANHIVARLTRDAMQFNLDAAVAKLNRARPIINEQLEIGSVTGVRSPQLGMTVIKSGRRSKVTTGMVTGIAGQTAINYGGYQRIIKNIVHIVQANADDQVSAPGDSGSWWLEQDSRRVVGLHFAGSNHPEYGLAISMPEVLNALEVDVALQ